MSPRSSGRRIDAEADRRIDMTAGDRPDAIGHRDDAKPNADAMPSRSIAVAPVPMPPITAAPQPKNTRANVPTNSAICLFIAVPSFQFAQPHGLVHHPSWAPWRWPDSLWPASRFPSPPRSRKRNSSASAPAAPAASSRADLPAWRAPHSRSRRRAVRLEAGCFSVPGGPCRSPGSEPAPGTLSIASPSPGPHGCGVRSSMSCAFTRSSGMYLISVNEPKSIRLRSTLRTRRLCWV